MARITISFKNTEKDKKLYDYWNDIEDKSVEIKNILRKVMEEREGPKDKTSNEVIKKVKEKVNNILDF